MGALGALRAGGRTLRLDMESLEELDCDGEEEQARFTDSGD